MKFKAVEDIGIEDRIDLSSCPYMNKHPMAEFEYGLVVHTERETENCIVLGYEGIDHVGYPVGTQLAVA